MYCCKEVDDAAELLTAKLVGVLNHHAPWIVFQQRKFFVPWITPETVQLMDERDRFKEQAIAMASSEVGQASQSQAELWEKYKKLRNRINNRTKQEEITYKKSKVKDCGPVEAAQPRHGDLPRSLWSGPHLDLQLNLKWKKGRRLLCTPKLRT